MKHFADFSAKLDFFNLSVLKQKFNIRSSESDFYADLFADLIPAGTGWRKACKSHNMIKFYGLWTYLNQNVCKSLIF